MLGPPTIVNTGVSYACAAPRECHSLRCLTLCRRWPGGGLGVDLLFTIVIELANVTALLRAAGQRPVQRAATCIREL